MRLIIAIEPRYGVDPRGVIHWLEANFQQAGTSESQSVTVDRNLLINARIELKVVN